MNVDVVNQQNEKVGTIELSDELFGGRPRTHLVWESVVATNARGRRGTHATKTRSAVSGTGKKPWKQKGTGRARVGESRNPLWRKGGTVFGPVPRGYGYELPRRVEKGALAAALAVKAQEGALVVVDQLGFETPKSKEVAAMLRRLGATGTVVVVDVAVDAGLEQASRNISGVQVVASSHLASRDVMGARRVVVSRAAVERLQEVLAS